MAKHGLVMLLLVGRHLEHLRRLLVHQLVVAGAQTRECGPSSGSIGSSETEGTNSNSYSKHVSASAFSSSAVRASAECTSATSKAGHVSRARQVASKDYLFHQLSTATKSGQDSLQSSFRPRRAQQEPLCHVEEPLRAKRQAGT